MTTHQSQAACRAVRRHGVSLGLPGPGNQLRRRFPASREYQQLQRGEHD